MQVTKTLLVALGPRLGLGTLEVDPPLLRPPHLALLSVIRDEDIARRGRHTGDHTGLPGVDPTLQ
jgi:hypothetical protein